MTIENVDDAIDELIENEILVVKPWDTIKVTVEGKDNSYKTAGYIGFILYAQSGVFFDNLVITNTFPVDPRDAFTTTWGRIKQFHASNK